MSNSSPRSFSKAWGLGFLGFLVGLPMSYFFQVPLIRQKVSWGGYITHLPDIFKEIFQGRPGAGDVLSPIIMTCLVCAAIFAFIGYTMDKKARENDTE